MASNTDDDKKKKGLDFADLARAQGERHRAPRRQRGGHGASAGSRDDGGGDDGGEAPPPPQRLLLLASERGRAA